MERENKTNYKEINNLGSKQMKKKDFEISYIGRMAGNKQVDTIFDIMMPLFALHNIKLKIVTTEGVLVC